MGKKHHARLYINIILKYFFILKIKFIHTQKKFIDEL
jgi:hypothetical protein